MRDELNSSPARLTPVSNFVVLVVGVGDDEGGVWGGAVGGEAALSDGGACSLEDVERPRHAERAAASISARRVRMTPIFQPPPLPGLAIVATRSAKVPLDNGEDGSKTRQ